MSLIGPVELHLPAPFNITTSNITAEQEYPIDKTNRANSVAIKPRVFTITAVDQNALMKPDVYLRSMPYITSVHAHSEEFRACNAPLVMWLQNLHVYMVPVVMVATQNVKIINIFERIN
ncbi:unnamed protein product [Arctia plantaginis]|uniref:Uncharacterized protein n=1 Tax=Arctia plantaginis TaxID=874455 RepID=A0A8S1BV15_ARCPL|nr:unnamed protein product [Arctia plantaginis]